MSSYNAAASTKAYIDKRAVYLHWIGFSTFTRWSVLLSKLYKAGDTSLLKGLMALEAIPLGQGRGIFAEEI